MLDRDFANRFLAFYLLGYEKYQPDLDTYMSKAMAMINEKSDEELEVIKTDFSKAMELAHSVFGREAFRKVYYNYSRLPPINKALFDAIATQFALITDDVRQTLNSKKVMFKEGLFKKLNEDEYFFISISSSTGDKNRIIKRHSVIAELIQSTINS